MDNPLSRKLDDKNRLYVPQHLIDELFPSKKAYIFKSRLIANGSSKQFLPVVEIVSFDLVSHKKESLLEEILFKNPFLIKSKITDYDKILIPSSFCIYAQLQKEIGLYLNSQNSLMVFPWNKIEEFHDIKETYFPIREKGI